MAAWTGIAGYWNRFQNLVLGPPTGPLRHAGCRNDQLEHFRKYTTINHGLIGISCRKFIMEWVLSELVLPEHRGEEVLVVNETKFYVINRPDTESLSVFPINVRIANLSDLSSHLRAGDHIKHKMDVPADLYHHAIVEDVRRVDGSCDSVTLIHWQGNGGSSNSSSESSGSGGASIQRNTVDDMSQRAAVIYRCDYREDMVREDNRELTLARANAWVGESQGYNLTQNNCEHFAFFCKTGLWQSGQGEFWANMILRITRLLYVDEYEDTTVESFTDLSPGDHVIMFMTVIHPRCHMIVKSTNHASGLITVVRFTYENGIVEESLPFRRPCKRVIPQGTYEPQVILERANAALENGSSWPYNIFTFNCKHFAFLMSRGYRLAKP